MELEADQPKRLAKESVEMEESFDQSGGFDLSPNTLKCELTSWKSGGGRRRSI